MQTRDRERLRFRPGTGRFALLLFVAAATLHCGAEAPFQQAGTEPPPLLALSPSNAQIAQGTGQQFRVRGLSLAGRAEELTARVKWSVVAPRGAALPASADGLIELARPGRYQVTAEYQGRRVDTALIVTAATIKSLAVSPSTPKIPLGLTQQFVATATFSDGTTQDVSGLSGWSIKDTLGTGVASINTVGLLTSKSLGKARITVKYLGKTTTTTIEVTAAALKTLTVSPLDQSIAKGTTLTYTAVGSFTDGTVQDVTASADWSVRDLKGAGVASIDGAGTALGEAVGQAEVSAEYLTLTAETTLTVAPAAVVALTVSPATASLAKGTTQQYTAIARLTDGSNQDVSALAAWTSTDVTGRGVAAVDVKGLAKGNAVGTATIGCAYRGYTATAALEVKPAALIAVGITPATATIAKGLAQQFKLVGSYTDGTTQDVTAAAVWTTKDLLGSDVASITAGGLALGKNLGQAQLQADHMGKSATAALTVGAPVMTLLTLAPQSPGIDLGATQQFSVQALFSDGTSKDVSSAATFAVTDVAPGSGVATISASGLATGKSKGRATVSASYLMLSAQTTLAVGLPPGVCSPDGWCWRNPLPQGRYLPAVWGSDANNVWTVSDDGIILKWSGSSWDAQTSGTTKNLLGIWGSDANNVWAVGLGGTILKWNGSTWSTQPSGTTVSLAGVFGTDSKNVWAVGDGGTILKWNGTAWSAQSSGTTVYLRGIWGTDANNLWTVGPSGTILRWNGTAWTAQPSVTFQYLRSVWGTDANNVWAVGAGGAIVRWDGTTWTAQLSGTALPLRGVWGTDVNNVYAVGFTGTILRWNGVAWSSQASGVIDNLQAIWGKNASNLWAVGDTGTILKGNGATWSTQSPGSRANLNAIWGSDVNNVWAVGSSGAILKWNGASFTAQSSGFTGLLRGVWGSDANNVWTVGTGGTILKWSGTSWAAQASGTTENLNALWGTDANNIWAVGSNGTLLQWNGTAWAVQPSGTVQHLNAIWGSDAKNIWAVGAAGTVLKWDGTAWTAQTTDVSYWHNGVWGSDSKNVWLAGSSGVILKWDGSAWAAQTSGTTDQLNGIAGSDAKNVWAVGANGTIVRWDGTSWAVQSSGTAQWLNSAWGIGTGNVWVAGVLGTILQHGL